MKNPKLSLNWAFSLFNRFWSRKGHKFHLESYRNNDNEIVKFLGYIFEI